MKLSIALRLARVSLLPTVWTNVLAGVALGGGDWRDPRVALVMLAMSLAYTGGMFLNDAFDREFDARVRPDRPLPAGLVSAREVFAFGYGMLLSSVLALAGVGLLANPPRWDVALVGLLLATVIVLYDAWHKQNPVSPLVMGACRMLVYVIAALAVNPQPGPGLWLGATVLLCYLIGLTYAAKSEHLARLDRVWPLGLLIMPLLYALPMVAAQPWILLPSVAWSVWTWMAVRKLVRRSAGDVPNAVGALLAGISIVDAIVLAGCGEVALSIVALLIFPVTMRLQSWVRGT